MTKVYLPEVYAKENELAYHIKRLIKSKDRCDKISASFVDYGDLKEDQPNAVDLACSSPISILRGLPGTGKTTTLRQVVNVFHKAGMKGAAFCPTGKASKRVDEVVNGGSKGQHAKKLECKTIHMGLGFSEGSFYYSCSNPLPYDFVILDEFSMAGLNISNSFFSAIDPNRTRVLISGDYNQLPSVDYGNVMFDMVASGIIPETNLTHLFRQGANSGIAFNAHQILSGQDPVSVDPRTGEPFTDFYTIFRNDPDEAYKYIVDCVLEKIPEKKGFDPIKDIQVLSPGKKGAVGTKILNDELRDRLNPGNKDSVTCMGFRKNDKVINRKNNYDLDIVNGDSGQVVDVGRNGATIDFGFKTVDLNLEVLRNVYLAYAYTVHASQGSEYKCIVSPFMKTHWMLLFRNLFYTAITRASELVIAVVNPIAMRKAIKTTVIDKRQTRLQELLAT